jgi:long-chain acyl-CoA synthetase
MNMASFCKKWVAKTPDKAAIIFQGNRISYQEFDKMVNKVPNGLVNLGLKKGDVVSLFLASCPELPMSYLGTVRAGIVVNVLNAMLKEIEVEYIMNDGHVLPHPGQGGAGGLVLKILQHNQSQQFK